MSQFRIHALLPSLFITLALVGCTPSQNQETPQPQSRLSEAPNGTCVRVQLKYDPLPTRIGLVKRDPSAGQQWIILNGPNPVPVEQVISISEMIEPSPEKEAEWTHCVKQFALRDF